MRRTISLVLAVLLALSLLCGALAEEKTYDRVTVTYTCPQVVAGYDYNAPNGDGYSNWILGKFNIDFQGTNVSWGDWMNNLVTWIYAQDMTDVAIYNFSENTATTAIAQRIPPPMPSRPAKTSAAPARMRRTVVCSAASAKLLASPLPSRSGKFSSAIPDRQRDRP